MKHQSAYLIYTLLLLFSVLLSACSSLPLEPKSTMTYTIAASSDINPDIHGQASSVVVKVMQLANVGNFNNAGYETIFTGRDNELGNAFIAMEEHLVDPDSTQTFKLELSKRTQFLGVAVGYRRVDSVTWKTVLSLPKKSFLDPRSLLGNGGPLIAVDKSSVQIINQ